MLNRETIGRDCAPKDGNFGFNISELEAMLPAGTVDHAVKPVYKEVSVVKDYKISPTCHFKCLIMAIFLRNCSCRNGKRL